MTISEHTEGMACDFDKVRGCFGFSYATEGGVLVWVVSRAELMGFFIRESGASFRQALGFMERGYASLHQTMYYEQAMPSNPDAKPIQWKTIAVPMFVFSAGKPAKVNLIQ